jgi:hypothetical protein
MWGIGMKKFIIAGLFAAVAAFTMAAQATAANRYCRYNPDDPQCQVQLQPQDYCPPEDVYCNDVADQPMEPSPRQFHRHDYRDNNPDFGYFGQNYYDQGPVIHLQFGPRYTCNELSNSLRRSGFRRVRPVDCAGRDFAFTAFRDGRSLRIGMSSRTGRINSIKPY